MSEYSYSPSLIPLITLNCIPREFIIEALRAAKNAQEEKEEEDKITYSTVIFDAPK